MSYGPPPTPEEERQIQAFSDAVDGLLKPAPLWRCVLHYPCFIALAGAQVVVRRWDEWRAR